MVLTQTIGKAGLPLIQRYKTPQLEREQQARDWDADEVWPRIWLGDVKAGIPFSSKAQKKTKLQQAGVTHIVSLIGTSHFPKDFEYLSLDLLDATEQNIMPTIPVVNQFIDNALSANGAVLIHW